jgi:hypothetical protein
MNAKKILISISIAAILVAVAVLAIFGRKSETVVVVEQIPPSQAPAIVESTQPAPVPAPEAKPEIKPAPTQVQPVVKNNVAQSPQPAQLNQKEPLQDPAARVALAYVGADPDAEAYWLGAIYDTSLPDSEREDLMEDLNEDGLSDPKHPGPQDLPLILNRLALIEEIAPNADDFMLEHLGEAYKDLVNLANITQGGGQPVN